MELILILIIVVFTAYYVGRKLYRQAKYGECENCCCHTANRRLNKLIDDNPPEPKKPDRNSG
jgi:hypothetical protein